MPRSIILASALGLLMIAQPAYAAPPSDAKPLSEILKSLEDSGNVAYFDEIEWDDEGWEIEYHTPDGSEVEVKIDPVSGQPKN